MMLCNNDVIRNNDIIVISYIRHYLVNCGYCVDKLFNKGEGQLFHILIHKVYYVMSLWIM